MAKEQVLIAEDDPASRLVLSHALEVAGFDVLACEDGQEAMSILSDGDTVVDALVTDCYMPEVDGLTLAKFVRERSDKHIPVIMVTSLEYSLAPEVIAANGIDHVIGKPFSPRSIGKILRELLDTGKTAPVVI